MSELRKSTLAHTIQVVLRRTHIPTNTGLNGSSLLVELHRICFSQFPCDGFPRNIETPFLLFVGFVLFPFFYLHTRKTGLFIRSDRTCLDCQKRLQQRFQQNCRKKVRYPKTAKWSNFCQFRPKKKFVAKFGHKIFCDQIWTQKIL